MGSQPPKNPLQRDPSRKDLDAARIIWDYHLMGQTPVPSDLIFVLGSHDLRVAERAAELFHQGFAPKVLLSGGLGNFTRGVFEKPEAELLAEVAIENGVPREHLLIENRSTNTGENVVFSRALLAKLSLVVTSVIAVQKPYMERRTYATIRKQWPEVTVNVTSPQLDFANYCTLDFPFRQVIQIMVGDLRRIMDYPAKGYQIEQAVPASVRGAFDLLVARGYTEHLA